MARKGDEFFTKEHHIKNVTNPRESLDMTKALLDGSILMDGEDVKQQEYLDQALGAYDGVRAPDLSNIKLDRYQYEGDINPNMIDAGEDVEYADVDSTFAQNFSQGDTELKNISTDPRLRDAQLAALSSLSEIGNNGGMTAADQANLSRIQSGAAQADKGRRDAILQNMAARGMGGSGMELLAQLQSAQAATDRQAQEGLDVAGMAQQRALDALAGAGTLGGNIRGQDFGEQSEVASAQDAINRFNTQNSIANSQFNTGVANNMGQFNAGNRLQNDQYNRSTDLNVSKARTDVATGNRDASQKMSNANTDLANKQKVDLPQQQFDNSMKMAGAKQDTAKMGADYWGNEKETKRKQGNQIMGGVGTAVASMFSDKRGKRDIRKLDSNKVDAFLKSFNPQKFKYKDEANGKGNYVGPMAQDMQKSELGKDAVVEREDGMLGIDRDKMMGIQSAALKHLSDKIDSITKGKK